MDSLASLLASKIIIKKSRLDDRTTRRGLTESIKIETFRRSSSSFLFMILGLLFTCFIVCGSKCHFKAWKIVRFFIQNPAGYPATAGRIIRHAGYPAKWKIRPDNPALPDIRPNPNNKICTMYDIYSYSRRGDNLVLVFKCHEKERKLGRQAMVEIDR